MCSNVRCQRSTSVLVSIYRERKRPFSACLSLRCTLNIRRRFLNVPSSSLSAWDSVRSFLQHTKYNLVCSLDLWVRDECTAQYSLLHSPVASATQYFIVHSICCVRCLFRVGYCVAGRARRGDAFDSFCSRIEYRVRS